MASLVIREVTTGLDDFAQLHVQTLDGVFRISDPSDLRRKLVDRYDMFPCALPPLPIPTGCHEPVRRVQPERVRTGPHTQLPHRCRIS